MTPSPPEDWVRRPCQHCGGEVGPDRYCLQCGTLAAAPRDHFTERPAAWVAGVCDRGPVKGHNEDAMALLASETPGERAALVVLDGVSRADDSAAASMAGARAAREVLRGASSAATALTQATEAAQAAIVAETAPDSSNPASATFAAAVLEGSTIVHACVGDSRVYWLPDAGEPVQLTTDDSLAEVQVAAGTPREVAEASPQAHALTRWLGSDSDDPTARLGSVEVSGPGWLLVCTDGLWNYASSAADLHREVARAGNADAAELAEALLRFACSAGGHDNITVALARVGPVRDNDNSGTTDAPAREATDG